MPPSSPQVLVLGTHNKKKRSELEYLLAPYEVKIMTLSDFPQAIDVDEDGTTFAENARKKASFQARHLQAWVIGEDSGLVVDALDGAPGVFSARFAGKHGDDEANNHELLRRLQGIPKSNRGAHYVCHASLSDPEGTIHIDCEGICRGQIREQPSGSSGFGYDPLFEVLEYHRTFGELGPATKGALSHRARAMRLFLAEWEQRFPSSSLHAAKA
jgi:XTP/dITP diphosphohydrolase